MKNSIRYFVLSLSIIYLLNPVSVDAQMFSVQPERQQTIYVPDLSINFGFSYIDFQYRGPFMVDAFTPAGSFEFSEPVFHIGVDMPGFSAYGLFGRSLGTANNSYSQIGASVGNNFFIIPGRTFNLSVPVRLATDYVVVKNNQLLNTQEFKQNTFGIHSGLEMRTRLSNKSRFEVLGSAGYSYSVSGFGNSGGTATDLSLKNRLYFDGIIRQYGLMIGFELSSRKYDLENEIYRYLAVQQQVVFGITF